MSLYLNYHRIYTSAKVEGTGKGRAQKNQPREARWRRTPNIFPSFCSLSNSHRQISGPSVKTHFLASYNYDEYNRMLIYLTWQFWQKSYISLYRYWQWNGWGMNKNQLTEFLSKYILSSNYVLSIFLGSRREPK